MESVNNEYKLFVGNIPVGTTSDELQEVFKQYGQPDEVYLVPKTGFKGMSYAFVRYPRKDMSDAAIAGLNGKHQLSMSSEPIIVRYSERSRNSSGQTVQNFPVPAMMTPAVEAKLFVGNLPLSVTKPEIHTVFSPFGEILEIVMLKAGRGTHLSCFVKMAKLESANTAIDALDGKHTMVDTITGANTTIQVRARFDGQRGGGGGQQGYGQQGFPPMAAMGMGMGMPGMGMGMGGQSMGGQPMDEAKLFVGNLPLNTTKEALHTLFVTYGKIREVVMLKAGRGTHMSAFVKMEKMDSAQSAIEGLDGKHAMQDDAGESTNIQVRWAQKDQSKRKRQEMEMMGMAGNMGGQWNNQMG
eukprot:CAMPEP_0181296566 /NCGR_PEP_ID=MMETSP1101-20121128/4773_1 /TAXON_ID=46948 /ORGANISM="Rhodomonas abbreviata, Strain Caron Lab Isolate" /LENGTH=354 /DNA_ID=CAMNT_0023401441 /DNA_START=149 /DNA_END=1209 /DNA_ORIENTATION=+